VSAAGRALAGSPASRPIFVEQLASRLGWLVGFRLSFLTLLFGLTASFYLRSGFRVGTYSNRVLLVTLVMTYAASAIYYVALRRRRHVVKLALAELVVDQATWTALIYVTGGATSGATALYGLTCLAGAILIGPRGPFAAALAGAIFYSLLCAAFASGAVAVPPDQPRSSYAVGLGEIIYPFFINLLVLMVVTLLAEYLAERLRLAGGRLEEATQRAEDAERLAALGRIAAGLAHEIRNPLGSIVGSVQLLTAARGLSDEGRRLCGIVERETGRLNDLVEDMLQLARPRQPVLGEVDVARTAREVVALASQSGRGSDVDVRYEGPGEAEHLVTRADAGQLRQVVWNLVRNAVQASSPGEQVTVRVAPDAPASRGKAPPGAVLEVHDDGPGIGTEAQARLFDAFFTTRSSGMGIGLAVVKRIVDEHGWLIEVDSREGRGATFRVRMGYRVRLPGATESHLNSRAR
jgi:two-component system, NtrC family, sensor histidine kinase HydH